MNLELFNIEKIDHLVQPEEFYDITPDSPALNIFTDFKKHKPLVIDANVPAIEAEKMMLKAHVKLKLVVDKKLEFVGTIGLDDLAPQNIMQRVNQGEERSSILVSHLMKSRLLVKALDFSQLEQATVQDVIEALSNYGLQHCLVVDTRKHQIRGLISASDIARRLHIPVVINESPTFADIFKNVVAAVR